MKETIVLAAVLLLFAAPAQALQATIYENGGCGHCGPYLLELKPVLSEMGYGIVETEFVNDQAVRRELAQLQESFNVPITMQGHMVVNIDGKYLLEGHIPVEKVREFLRNPPNEKTVVYLDDMSGQPLPYLAMSADGSVKECDASQQILECLEENSAVDGNATGAFGGEYSWLLAALVLVVPLGLVYKYGR